MSDGVNTEGLTPLKRALLSIETLKGRVRALESEHAQSIAIVGSGCRFPGGGINPEAFYEALLSGRDAIQPHPPVARPGWPAIDELPPAGYLDDDVSGFDAAFFGISPREAASIDPQHRLALECSWEALESAGIDPRSLEGTRTGVFLGMAANDYAQMQLRSGNVARLLNPHFASGIGHSMASGRLSYLLGLQGPAITIDTACSSSLVAVHLACQSLRSRESDLSLAVGVNLILALDYTVAFQQSRMLSQDGRCRTFDADADGFSRAEGCGVVVLKRLDDAERDGDRILAVIRATAVNQDGPSSGLTAPNGPAQAAVIRTALKQAGLAPADIGYIEAHGTGTALGDPIEMQALGEVFNEGRSDSAPLLVGSVKTNLGHLEAAAGIAGLIKLVQSIRHGSIPAHLHFRTPSPHIPWDELNIAVPAETTAFPVTGGSRRGGVSAFGFSGTNVHVIVEQAPAVAAMEQSDDAGVLTVSAADDAALRALAQQHAAHLRSGTARFVDTCITANAGRAALSHRIALVASNAADAAGMLDGWLAGDSAGSVKSARLRGTDRPATAFLFTGQGAQYAGMGLYLYGRSAAFRRALATCDEILRPELEVPLLDVLDPAGAHAELVHRTDYTQPALFALQYALTELWRSRGIEPVVVVGHSIGEYAAAHLAGVFRLEDALRLVALRGRLMQGVTTAGSMEAVFAEEARVAEWVGSVGGGVSVAGINAHDQTVISGAVDAVRAVVERARAAGVSTRPLRTSQAFHSPLMDDVVDAFRTAVASVPLEPGRRVRFISTMTGDVLAPEALADAGYWARQLREPVRFSAAAAVVASHAAVAVEIGPHPALTTLVRQSALDLPVIPSLERDKPEWMTLLAAHRDLYVAGVAPAWRPMAADSGMTTARVDLPTYPFQRVPLWVELGTPVGPGVMDGHALLGRALAQPGPARTFERTVSADAPAFIGDHEVLGRVILPGTAFIEMAFAAGAQLGVDNVEMRDLDLIEPMLFAEDEQRRVHCRCEPAVDNEWRMSVYSAPEPAQADAEWTLHANAHIATGTRIMPHEGAASAAARCTNVIEAADFHTGLAARGYAFGPRLQGVQRVRVGAHEVVAEIALPDACADDTGRYSAHPLILDAGLQAISCALDDTAGRAYLPMAVGRAAVSGDLTRAVRVHARVLDQRNGAVTAEAVFLSADDTVIAVLEGVVFREMKAADAVATDEFLEVCWVMDERPAAMFRDSAGAARVHAQLRAGLARAAQDDVPAEYDAFVDALEAESVDWVCRAFYALGWTHQPGDVVGVDALADSLRVVPERRRLLARMLDILAEQGVLERAADRWRVLTLIPPPHPLPILAPGDAPPEQVLLRRCGPALADALRGSIDPLELLFPGGDGSLAESMYYDAPIARILNAGVADTVAHALAQTEPGRVLRVLEVGGGTAGTTRRLVERLYANGAKPALRYMFTDVSRMFIERARQRFRDVDGFEFGTLDLDRAPEEQGYEAGSFDIIIGANCLHAARDLGAALGNVGRLLRPGGLLVAAEVFAPHRWFDLTVGLTDGWWHFTDTALRPEYACVAPAVWSDVLQATGFEHTVVVPLAEAAGTAGHASRSQGLVVSFRAAAVAAQSADDAAWLMIDDDGALARDVARLITADGGVVTRLGLDTLMEHADPVSRIALALSAKQKWAGVLHCAADAESRIAHDTVLPALRRRTGSLLAAAQALSTAAAEVTRLCVITRNAQRTDASEADCDPVAAASWGLARTIAQELPGVACYALDTDDDPGAARHAAHWLHSEDMEPEVARRGRRTLVPRLQSRTIQDGGLPAEYRLSAGRGGSIDSLTFEAGERGEPGVAQVEIRVAASALNFKDVLNVLGMYPGDAGPLGAECAGVVTRVGDDVTHVQPGDAVIAAAGNAYGRHVIAEAALVARKPEALGFAAAATIPIAYLTAHFALNHLAGMHAGDRVLVHAAAGGVGLAACHLALRAGARVIATAGNEEKRRALRDLGIRDVFDSRSLSFADDVMTATGGEGVTIVLNSLSDEFVERSFAVTAAGARFLEIGKRGIWSVEQVAALNRDIAYHVIDWGVTAREEPALMGRLFVEVVDAVERGELPPLPRTDFDLAAIRDAFRYMAQAKHTGKIVVRHPVTCAPAPIRFRTDASYLITGGTTGLGLVTAEWAAARGARTLVLVSRRTPDAAASAIIERMRSSGIDVHALQCDVGDAAGMRTLLDHIERDLPVLRGVIHAAGALADRTLHNMRWEDFEIVLRSKVRGTLLLSDAVQTRTLDFFIAYSSIASVFGSPGQSNHSTANAFMDAYVADSWRAGRVGMSIAWGPWSETGAAVRNDVIERTRQRGLEPIDTDTGVSWLDSAFSRPGALLVGARVAQPELLGARQRRFVRDLAPAKAARKTVSGAVEPAATPRPFAGEIASLPAGARRAVVVNRVKTRVRAVLGLPAESQLDTDRPLGELGLDSLLAIELRNVLGEDAGRRLPATLLFDHPTTGALAENLLALMEPREEAVVAPRIEAAHDPLAAVDAMSDDDVDRLLAEKLST